MAEQFFGNIEGIPEEDFFRVLERSKPYKDMERLTRKALLDQWNDFILSGVVNSIYTQYKTFLSASKKKPAKIQKNFQKAEEVTSEEELKELETEMLQGDKFMVDEKSLKTTAFLLFLGREVDKNLKSIGSYYKFKQEYRDYLRIIANKAGQTILDQIPMPKPIKFRLSNKELKLKIKDRVDRLVKQLDATTKKTLVKQLVLGVKNGETKTQLVKRLQQKGVKLAKIRAKRIVATETEALAEYMRYETALLNGVKTKTWATAEDERVCPICLPLDGQTVPIKQNFDGDLRYPPAHVMCRCSVDYAIEDNLAGNFIKKRTGLNLIDEIYQKAKGGSLYKPVDPKNRGIVNPNAVWAGGESLVGPDRDIANIYEAIRDARPIAKEALLEQAETKLTLEGMVQLKSMLGMSPNIKRNN